MQHRSARPHDNWSLPGTITALGALVLMGGLMSGPTPASEVAQALRDIDGFRTRYIATNMVAFAGATVMCTGLLILARFLTRSSGSLAATLGGVGVAGGGSLFLLVLVIESVTHPALAARYVEANPTGRELHLAVGQAVWALDAAVFGVAFMLMMGGIAALFASLLVGGGPAIHRAVLWVGVALAGLASPAALAHLFEPTRAFGQLEPILGIAVLLWLIVLGALLRRAERR